MTWFIPKLARAPAELVLFVVWPNGRPHARRVMRAILDRYQPLVIRSLPWSRTEAPRRLSELYGLSPEAVREKCDEIGEGECTVVVAVDHRPRFAWCGRNGGLANRDASRLKRRARRLAGSDCLHASETEDDVLWFLAILLDEPVEYYLNLKQIAVRAAARPAPRSLSEIFGVLNTRVRYTVLRNWQALPGSVGRGVEDVDLLVDDPAPVLASFPGLWKKHTESYRVHFYLPMRPGWVRREWVPVDLRHVGDGYYETNWERGMLDRRILSPRGFYHLSEADHFDAILYHALLHKPRVRDDYRRTLSALGRLVTDWSDTLLDDPRRALEFLARRVPIQKPDDLSACWNSALLASRENRPSPRLSSPEESDEEAEEAAALPAAAGRAAGHRLLQAH